MKAHMAQFWHQVNPFLNVSCDVTGTKSNHIPELCLLWAKWQWRQGPPFQVNVLVAACLTVLFRHEFYLVSCKHPADKIPADTLLWLTSWEILILNMLSWSAPVGPLPAPRRLFHETLWFWLELHLKIYQSDLILYPLSWPVLLNKYMMLGYREVAS